MSNEVLNTGLIHALEIEESGFVLLSCNIGGDFFPREKSEQPKSVKKHNSRSPIFDSTVMFAEELPQPK